MTKIVYVGPSDEVEIADLGETCQRGRVIDVPAEMAGRIPTGQPGDEDYDPGEGLLAQDTWSKPNTAEAKAARALPLEASDDPPAPPDDPPADDPPADDPAGDETPEVIA